MEWQGRECVSTATVLMKSMHRPAFGRTPASRFKWYHNDADGSTWIADQL
jgi:hypothetical protein